MALVMLPCDLPWWSNVCKKLDILQKCTDVDGILEMMQKIHDLCNVSLDPEEDKRDSTIFNGLKDFLLNDMKPCECEHFISYTLVNLVKSAQSLKMHRPFRGFNFSLQQQPDSIEINRKLIAALLANAFFSTFPKRTEKTHPTLQDFNFTYFFSALDSNSQKAKLRSFLYYFDWIDSNQEGGIKISRKVMPGKQWLTIEDWLECDIPLCPMEIKHEGKIERSRQDVVQTVFATSRIGGNVLWNGNSQECMNFAIFPELLIILLYVEALEDNEALFVENVTQLTRIIDPGNKSVLEILNEPRKECMNFAIFPELLIILLYVEALEDNEALFVENVTQLTRIIDPGNKSVLEILNEPRKISLCFMDAENYWEYPASQFEEDNILREVNKCLLAYRQNATGFLLDHNGNNKRDKRQIRDFNIQKRLSPIGESGTNSPSDFCTQIIIKQASTRRSSFDSGKIENNLAGRRNYLAIDPGGGTGVVVNGRGSIVTGPTGSGRRGRFIVLGSSGECLPVNRTTNSIGCDSNNSMYSSCDSSSDDYQSANDSFELESDDEDLVRKYSNELDTPEKRYAFAEKLREALRLSDNYTESTDDSYAVDISIAGSKTGDDDEIRIKRGGSRGFVLTEDSVDDDFSNESLHGEKDWIEKFRNKLHGSSQRKDSHSSSKYSFSSEYSSDLEEIYEQFTRWLTDPIFKNKVKELDPRDEAVLRFANSLLKRTLSESFVGVPLTEGCISSIADENAVNNSNDRKKQQYINARSLSLELAKYKHRLAAQLKLKHQPSSKSSIKPQKKHKKWSISQVNTQQTIDCDDVTLKISQIGKKRIGKGGVRSVATGNWGCGETLKGNVQLKLVIQWMAASVAGLPVLIYYTSGHEKLAKLDTVCRVLLDRKWTVGELAIATLAYAKEVLNDPNRLIKNNNCFFDQLIGI